MSKVRVYEVAKQLNMDQKAVVAIFQSMGVSDVRNHMSAVESDLIERVKRHVEKQKNPEGTVEERIRPTVVKRKARAADPDSPSSGVPSSATPPSAAVSSAMPSSNPASSHSVPSAAPSSTGVAPSHRQAPAAAPSATRAEERRTPTSPPSARAIPTAHEAPASEKAEANSAQPAKAESHGPAHSGEEESAISKASPSKRGAPSTAGVRGKGPASVGKTPGADIAAEPPSRKRSVRSTGSSTHAVGEASPAGVGADLDFDAEPPPSAPVAAPAQAAAPAAASEAAAAGKSPASRAGVKAPPSSKAGPKARGAQTGDAETAPAHANGAESGPSSAAAPASAGVASAQQAAASKQSSGPQSTGPQSVGPQSAGPQSVGPQSAAPHTAAPHALRDPAGARQAVPPPAAQQTGSVPPPAAPNRPSTPPRTGIDVWQGRPGVPMPQARAAAPAARRTTYDPRAGAAAPRPGANLPNVFPGGGRPRPGQQNRPPFRRPGMGGPNSSFPRKPANVSTLEMSAHKKVIKIEEQVTLQGLAAKMSLKVTDVLMRLLSMGMTGVNINSTIDSDTAKILANEFGWTVEDVAVSEEATLEAATGLAQSAVDTSVTTEGRLARPPIVTVMGHVDHGKTSLLDKIRKASVAAGEAGGITQHIGAYRVETSHGTVAFLDTPGHEAFTAMRARGAQVTDIVILVVAADDGVMPQTREAITHAQQAKVPIVVAVNKIDKPGADVEKIKRELANLGLQPEDWGGTTIFVQVSALTGEGIDTLLEAILLQAEVLELTAQPKKRASGVVIEALLDRGRGPVARIMVQDGTIKVGDIIIAGPAWGKVRAMTDEFGRALTAAGPSTPIEVLGLGEVPSAGDPVHAVKDGKTAEEIAETRRKKANKSLIPQDSRVSLEALKDRLSQEDQLELKLIIKGDVQGSVEAVASALSRLTTPKVKVTIVNAAVGAITEGDVNLAIASKAIIVGFNVRPAGKASSLAEAGGIEIRPYTIIYNAVDDIRSAMEGLLPTTKIEKGLGKAEIRQVFKMSKAGIVAGCYVTSGVVKRGCECRLMRGETVLWTGKVASLKRIKDDVKEVAEGLECGISLDNYSDFKEGDVIDAFEIEEIKTKL